MPAQRRRLPGCELTLSSAFPNPGLQKPQRWELPGESPNTGLWLRPVCTATEGGLWRATRTHTLRDGLELFWGAEGLLYDEAGQ